MFNWYREKLKFTVLTTAGLFLFACSSQEYTTAKLAIQQSEWSKADEWLPKAMAVEPDNPEIPIVYAVEVMQEIKIGKKCMICFRKLFR